MSTNHFETLGISPDATEKEIKTAYKKLAKKYHPDLNGGDKASEAKFKEINEAYTSLTEKPKDTPNFQGFPGGEFHDFFNEAIFDQIFRGGSARTINRVRVDPRLLISGGVFDYTVQLFENRSGRLHPVHRTVKIKVEPDTPATAQVVVPGTQPHHVFVQLIPGDTDTYRVTDMLHLTETHQIGAFRAMVGSEVEVTAPNGKKLKLTIPPGTQNGAVHRLRGLGLRAPDGRRGDYNVQFVVVIPTITGKDDEELKKNVIESFETGLKQ